MKALGQGSIASLVKIGLSVAALVLWIALGLIGLIALVALVAGVAVAFGAPFTLDGELTVSAPGITFSGQGLGFVSWPLLAAVLAAATAFAGGALVIVDRLSRLFKNFTTNEPFNKANAGHLRVIWMVMLAMELSRYAFALAVGWSVAAFGPPQGVDRVSIEPGFDLSTWTSILVLIVLAEVFREGARLREEHDLTI